MTSQLPLNAIAIIGMACRFPGANHVDAFWENIKEGVESVSEFSDAELAASGVPPSLLNNPDYVKKGFVIDDPASFDAGFFGYSPREAETMDPQHRLFLETAWQAFEDAAYVPDAFTGEIGIFAGAKLSTYLINQLPRQSLTGSIAGFQTLIGNDKDYLTSRVSYKLNLRGPSICVQTACSTSLVAVHMACESLLSGACDMALAGGAAIMVPQKEGYLFQEGMILSPDGRCRPFDARAKGIAGGNGVGAVLLKPLEAAIADRDRIHAVILGSAVNNDGDGKAGYTAPSMAGQSAVIREALNISQVNPDTIDYIEAHGTGTEIGDPMEISALTRVFSEKTGRKEFCGIGSVKANIGHLDTAAGVASLIKTVMALKHNTLPPSPNFRQPNPRINFSDTPFFVNDTRKEWVRNSHPRRAGVSSFGFGGTNAHVILEEAPDHPAKQASQYPLHLLTLSAKNQNALTRQIHNYLSFLESNPDVLIEEICFTANTGRSHFPYRFAAIAASKDDLHLQLTAAVQENPSPNLFRGHAGDGITPEVNFDAPAKVFDQNRFADIVSDSHTLEPHYHLPISWTDKDECLLFLSALGKLYVMGATIDWKGFYHQCTPQRISLPTYPFEKKRHWGNGHDRQTQAIEFLVNTGGDMPFTGRQLSCPTPIFLFEISLAACPFLESHKIFGRTIIPVGVFWEMLTAVGKSYFKTEHVSIKNMSQHEAMLISKDHPLLQIQIILETKGFEQLTEFHIFCLDESPGQSENHWRQYVSGEIAAEPLPNRLISFSKARSACKNVYEVSQFLSDFYGLNPDMNGEDKKGWEFQGIWTNKNSGLAKIVLSDSFLSETGFCTLHPSIFEPCLQTLFAVLLRQGKLNDKIFLPSGFDDVHYASRLTTEIWCYASVRPETNQQDSDFTADFRILTQQGDIIAQMDGAYMRQASSGNVLRESRISPYYEIQWQKLKPYTKSGDTPSRPASPGCWLIFGDREDIVSRLTQVIRDDGDDCVAINSHGRLRIHTGNGEIKEQIQMDANALHESLGSVLNEKIPSYHLNCSGVILCWGEEPSDELSGEELIQGISHNYSCIVYLLRAIIDSGLNITDFCLITRESQAVTGNETLDLITAPIWGMQKCLEKEHPEFNTHIFDLDGTSGSKQIQQIWRMLKVQTVERKIAFRDGNIYVPRLVPLNPPDTGSQQAGKRTAFDPNVTYLITGGFGGLGMEVADWLVENNVKYLVLIGRSNPGSAAREKIDKLQANGVRILAVKADITVFEAVLNALSDIQKSMPPLKGVFHLAGVLKEGDLLRQNLDDARETMAAKIEGAWNLHRATREESLDYFVLFSSISSLWGGHGLGAYAGANTFLDVLAHFRKTIGLPGISINWGAFSKAGMIAGDEKGALVRHRLGLKDFSPEEALSRMIRVREFAQACIVNMDWERFLVQPDMGKESFFSKLVSMYKVKDGTRKNRSSLLEMLANVSDKERNEMLSSYLTQKVSDALGIENHEISAQANLIQLGMDSLIFLSLIQTISTDLHIKIPPHKLFENPTIEGLLAQFAGKIQFEAPEVEESRSAAFMVRPDPDSQYEPFSLTDIQHAYWIGRSSVAELGNVACHVYFEIQAQGLDLDRYTAAWQQVVSRHDMLRAIILPDGRQQVLENPPLFQINAEDLRGDTPDMVSQKTVLIREEMSHQVRPTDQWPLFEVRATILDDSHTLLHISMDILIADGYSIFNLMREIDHFYRMPDQGLAPIECTFRDYVLAEAAFRDSDTYQQSERYWMDKLETLPPAPELPLAKSPSELEQIRFVRREARLAPGVWEQLQSYASQSGLTRANVLLSAFAEVLATWSKSKDFTLNLTFFHRLQGHPRINEVIGDFTSLILLQVDVSHDMTFMERTRKIQEQLWKDMEFRYFSGVRVLQELSRKNQGGERTLMPVVFTSNLGYEKIRPESSGLSLPGKLVYSISQTPQVWIDNQISEDQDGLLVVWDAVEDLFPDGMLDHMFDAYHKLLNQLARSGDAWRSNPVLLPETQVQRRREVNTTEQPLSPETLNSLFIKQMERQPDHTAVITPSGRISYKDLYHKSMGIASLLADHGAIANTLVAVVMEKGWEQVVAVMGILNSGAAYLPVDPAVPRERLWHLLKDGNVKLVLTQSWLEQQLEWSKDIKLFAVDAHDYTRQDAATVQIRQTPDDLAYVIHTSGSTGMPKGVMIDHKGAVNTILDINRRFHVSPEDRVFALSNLNFDLSVYDIFGTLAAGATIVMPDHALRKDPGHWLSLIREEHVTVWNSVPALMQMLVEHVSGRDGFHFGTLRLVLLSGDWIPLDLPDKIRKEFDPAEIISLGGATEASIWSIFYPVNTVDPDWNSIPYGRPMANQGFHVLNENMEPCPDWVAGQLYIDGTGLAKGYWRDREKTESSFIKAPRTGTPLYRTGDLGRFLPDGNIEFLGRNDQQVKINGYRIELGEIESGLKQIDGISDAVVVPVADQRKNRYLAGHVITEPDYGYTDKELKQRLEQLLPEYMVPGFYLFHDAFPVTANEKIDRKKLADPANISFQKDDIEYVNPENEMEQTISDIIKEILSLEKVSTTSLFSDLGATSMHFVQMQNRLNEVCAKNISVINIFEYPTVSSLARFISEKDNDSGSNNRTDKRIAIRNRLKRRNPGSMTG